jgi:uncharacterized protein YecE (DUF72 family)
MPSILIGTSGYSYADWVGRVYPAGAQQKDFLRLYAEEFSFVELNFSYYKQPDARTLERMLKLTGNTFRFAIKGHQSLTHERGGDVRGSAAIFKEGIKPLIEAFRLSAVVMQFPFSFHYSPDSRRHLDMVCGAFEHIPLAVEFRNDQWMRDSVYEGLRKRGVALINVDEPPLPGLPKPTAIATAPHAYVRFHGRNSANWWEGDNASRYDYKYSEQELTEWLPRLQSLAGNAKVLMVLFNNHWEGQAVENARMLKKMMEESKGQDSKDKVQN